MQKITQAQILALFLGSTSGLSIAGFINGLSEQTQVLEGQRLQKPSIATSCSGGQYDCYETIGDEKKPFEEPYGEQRCASWQEEGAEPQNICVAEWKCGQLGRRQGKAFSIQCWDKYEEGVSPKEPEAVDPIKLLSDVEGLITTPEQNWDGVEDIIVSSKFNHQDGWWIRNESDKWVETDKPVNNRCSISAECAPQDGVPMCCASYPDSNNKRCIPQSQNKKLLTIGPISFIPQCPDVLALDIVPDIVPENAEDDISKEALAEATEQLINFYQIQQRDAKLISDYESMDQSEKDKWDNEWKLQEEKRNDFESELKQIAKYDSDDCNDACKAAFESELLLWSQQKLETCKREPKGIACRQANEIKKEEEKARAGGEGIKNFYAEMNDDEKTNFKNSRAEEIASLESVLAAAYINDNPPEDGEAGSGCNPGGQKCTNISHCCGVSTSISDFDGFNFENVCAPMGSQWEDQLGKQYTHVCGSMRLIISAVAAAVAAVQFI